VTSTGVIPFQSLTYTVLMILTDGCINDMRRTINAIVDACDAPLSIIIVGVGNSSFRAMDELDGDAEPLMSSRGVRASRDIVQFVPFRQFAGANQFRLAQEVLAEVPRQVHEYCSTYGFSPHF
jgi:hypothetical protein